MYRFAGVRLPEFVDYLKGDRLQPQPGVKQYNDPAFWPKELDMLRWYAIKSKPRASFKSVLLEMLSNHPQSWSHLYGGQMMGDLDVFHAAHRNGTTGTKQFISLTICGQRRTGTWRPVCCIQAAKACVRSKSLVAVGNRHAKLVSDKVWAAPSIDRGCKTGG